MTTLAQPYADLRNGLIQCRRTLWQASWSPSWKAAERNILIARDELAAAVAVLAISDDEMPDSYDEALPHLTAFEALWTGCLEAFRLVARAIDAAAQSIAAGNQPTLACRRSISDAVRTLDRALDSVAKP